jgi:hypothetical protein
MSDQNKNNNDINFALIQQGLEHIKERVDDMSTTMNEIKANFVARKEMDSRIESLRSELLAKISLLEERIKPMKAILYGAAGLVGVTILTAIIQSIIK